MFFHLIFNMLAVQILITVNIILKIHLVLVMICFIFALSWLIQCFVGANLGCRKEEDFNGYWVTDSIDRCQVSWLCSLAPFHTHGKVQCFLGAGNRHLQCRHFVLQKWFWFQSVRQQKSRGSTHHCNNIKSRNTKRSNNVRKNQPAESKKMY